MRIVGDAACSRVAVVFFSRERRIPRAAPIEELMSSSIPPTSFEADTATKRANRLRVSTTKMPGPAGAWAPLPCLEAAAGYLLFRRLLRARATPCRQSPKARNFCHAHSVATPVQTRFYDNNAATHLPPRSSRGICWPLGKTESDLNMAQQCRTFCS
jgi:hypothetical protein